MQIVEPSSFIFLELLRVLSALGMADLCNHWSGSWMVLILNLSCLNTTQLPLPDHNPAGLDGVRFTCRATAHSGHRFEETVTIRTSGNYYILGMNFDPFYCLE